MFGRLFVLISRNLTMFWRFCIFALLTVNGAYRYFQEWYYYNKKKKLFEEYIDGFVYKGNYYLPDGTKTKEILLRHFGSVEKILSSPEEDLKKLVGEKKTAILLEYFKN